MVISESKELPVYRHSKFLQVRWWLAFMAALCCTELRWKYTVRVPAPSRVRALGCSEGALASTAYTAGER